jgi:hypothetical protein
MGRQTRQARRAQERRAQARGRQAAQGPDRKWVLAGIAVVLAAVALLVVFNATNTGTSGPTVTPTAIPAASIDRIGCNPGGEVVTYHQHAHLAMIDKGKNVPIPALIGFDVNHDCLFWVHTHSPSNGIIHEEAPSKIVPTLGTFFKIWQAPLTPTQIGPMKVASGEQVRTYVNGKRYDGSLAAIKLPRHADVVIEVGPPFVKPPKFNFASYNV